MSDSLRPHGLQHTRLPRPITNSRSLLKLMSVELVMPSKHLILCHPLLLLPSVFPSIKVFSNAGALSALSSSSMLGTYQPFSVLSFCLFMLLMGLSMQESWRGSPSPSPVDHVSQNSPPQPVCSEWPYVAWLIVSWVTQGCDPSDQFG